MHHFQKRLPGYFLPPSCFLKFFFSLCVLNFLAVGVLVSFSRTIFFICGTVSPMASEISLSVKLVAFIFPATGIFFSETTIFDTGILLVFFFDSFMYLSKRISFSLKNRHLPLSTFFLVRVAYRTRSNAFTSYPRCSKIRRTTRLRPGARRTGWCRGARCPTAAGACPPGSRSRTGRDVAARARAGRRFVRGRAARRGRRG